MQISGLKKSQHVYADYTYVTLVLAAPWPAGFTCNRVASTLSCSFAISALTYSLCTKAKWGVLKWIPYRIHAILDMASGVGALAVSRIPAIRKDHRALNTFLFMSVTAIVVGGLSLFNVLQKSKD